MNYEKNIIGQRINTVLADKNIKQKDLASALGVTDNTISYFVSGKRIPNTEQIIKISEFLNVSSDYLLGLVKEPSLNPEIQMIGNYTGLSTKAIEKLHKMTEKVDTSEAASVCIKSNAGLSYLTCFLNDIDSDNFNKIIEDTDFYNLIYMIKRYSQSELHVALRKCELQKAINVNDLVSQTELDINLSSQIDNSDICFFKSQRLFLDIVKRISKQYVEEHFRKYSKNISDMFKGADTNADD